MPVLLSFQDGKLMFGRKAGCLTPRFTAEDGLPRPCCGGLPYCSDPTYATIQISGYTDGDIPTCDDCAASPGFDGVWNGVMARTAGSVPSFEWDESGCTGDKPPCYHGACVADEIGGGSFSNAAVFQCPASGDWHLIVTCIEALSFQPLVLWKGTKTGGDAPTGTYTRDGGCNATPSSFLVVSGGSCP